MKHIVLLICSFCFFTIQAQEELNPIPKRTDGKGPFKKMVIRKVMVINGTGAPPIGKMDIIVEGNKIVNIVRASKEDYSEDVEIVDGDGMYALPGFVDTHAHIGGKSQKAMADYVFKLWMAHGITTIREVGSFDWGIEWTLKAKELSMKNKITAPRIRGFAYFGQGSEDPISTPEMAKKWVIDLHKKGGDGVKFLGARPDIMKAALEQINALGMLSTCHHAQMNVAWLNALQSARMGLQSMEHWYGLPEALLANTTVQNYPLNYNYNNEQNRFEEAGKLWQQAAPPYSEKWNAVMNELLKIGFTISPTFNIYEASRDLMRARRAEWHETYTLPALWRFYQPSHISHGSYWHYWGTEQETHWKKNYQLWMTFVNEYKNRGGRVVAGSDSGFIFQLYGFGYIRELELLREAGFHPLEVIRAATLKGAELLRMDKEIGSLEVGKKADIVLIEKNPLENLKVLYGTGAIQLMPDNTVQRVGGVKYTIKDGIIYDAKELLKQVKAIVDKAKKEENFVLKQPGEPE